MEKQPQPEQITSTAVAFDSVSALLVDPGYFGKALQRWPKEKWILTEADQWPNPWEFLLQVPDLPNAYRNLFLAAQSQRKALSRFAQIASGRGSLDTDWGSVLRTPDRKSHEKANYKIFLSYFRSGNVPKLIEAAEKLPIKMKKEVQAEIKARHNALSRDLRRNYGKSKADKKIWPITFQPQTLTQKIGWGMTLSWLTNPGYCFASDAAIRNMFRTVFPGLSTKTVHQTCSALGLIKAGVVLWQVNEDNSI